MWVEVKERVRRVGPHEFEPAGWQSSLCGFVREQAGAWLTRGEDKDDMRERSPRLVRAILRRLQHATVRSGWAVTMWAGARGKSSSSFGWSSVCQGGDRGLQRPPLRCMRVSWGEHLLVASACASSACIVEHLVWPCGSIH